MSTSKVAVNDAPIMEIKNTGANAEMLKGIASGVIGVKSVTTPSKNIIKIKQDSQNNVRNRILYNWVFLIFI